MNGRLLSARSMTESGCQRQSWSQRDFSGFSTSSGLATEWILFPSVPEAETSCLTRGILGILSGPAISSLISQFPSPAAVPCWSLASSCGDGTWPPLQRFFQLLNKGQENKVSLLAPSGFGHALYKPSCLKSKSVLNVLVCKGRWGLWGRLKSCVCC